MCLCRDYKKRPHAKEILSTSSKISPTSHFSTVVRSKAALLNIELDYSKTKGNQESYKQEEKIIDPKTQASSTTHYQSQANFN
jgi:hypothetical protein